VRNNGAIGFPTFSNPLAFKAVPKVGNPAYNLQRLVNDRPLFFQSVNKAGENKFG
jgi:hypothetical protein